MSKIRLCLILSVEHLPIHPDDPDQHHTPLGACRDPVAAPSESECKGTRRPHGIRRATHATAPFPIGTGDGSRQAGPQRLGGPGFHPRTRLRP